MKMVETINASKPTFARKDYKDMTRDFIEPELSGLMPHLTWQEQELIKNAQERGWMIRRGELYECGTYKYDGIIYRFRCLPGLAQICIDYDLFGEV